jgi:hypothetical protein
MNRIVWSDRGFSNAIKYCVAIVYSIGDKRGHERSSCLEGRQSLDTAELSQLVKTAPNNASGMCVHLQLIVEDDSEVAS